MRHVVFTRGHKAALDDIRQRYRVPNAFWPLPFGDRDCGIFGALPKEGLHVLDNGIYLHMVNALHDMFGEKDSGKKENTRSTNSSN